MVLHAAVSQRNVLESAAALEAQKEELLEILLEFFEQYVQGRFPRPDYTFDVYVTTAGKVGLDRRANLGHTACSLLMPDSSPWLMSPEKYGAVSSGMHADACLNDSIHNKG